jgi:hypothetical protein
LSARLESADKRGVFRTCQPFAQGASLIAGKQRLAVDRKSGLHAGPKHAQAVRSKVAERLEAKPVKRCLFDAKHQVFADTGALEVSPLLIHVDRSCAVGNLGDQLRRALGVIIFGFLGSPPIRRENPQREVRLRFARVSQNASGASGKEVWPPR